MNRKLWLISFSSLLLLLVVVYYQLGGWNEITIRQIQVEPFALAGRPYEGTTSDSQLRDLMREMYQDVQDKKLPGAFSVCYFGNPDSQDTIRIWVGAWLPSLSDTTSAIRAGYQTQVLQAGKALEATVTAHPLVAPSPTTVGQQLRDQATAETLSLQRMVLETYGEQHTVRTLIFVRP